MESLTEYLNSYVEIMALDNKIMVGILLSFDQSLNMILKNYIELEINTNYDEAPTESGVILVRGSNVSCISLLNINEESIKTIKNRTNIILPVFDTSLNS